MTMMIRLLLVDDQLLFRQGLASLLSTEPDLEIVGQASHGYEAIALVKTDQPDVILMDVRMPICDGVEATQIIHQQYPWIRILVLSTFDEDDYICRSLQAGALGYLLKDTPSEQVADAIRTLHQGHSQLSPTIAAKVFARLHSPKPEVDPSSDSLSDHGSNLSQREREVLLLLAQGKTNREIAQALHLTEGTVKNYVTQVLSVLGLRDRVQAALWAQRHLNA
jgi:DNA-binding NarL/FixJ family response regulator